MAYFLDASVDMGRFSSVVIITGYLRLVEQVFHAGKKIFADLMQSSTGKILIEQRKLGSSIKTIITNLGDNSADPFAAAACLVRVVFVYIQLTRVGSVLSAVTSGRA